MEPQTLEDLIKSAFTWGGPSAVVVAFCGYFLYKPPAWLSAYLEARARRQADALSQENEAHRRSQQELADELKLIHGSLQEILLIVVEYRKDATWNMTLVKWLMDRDTSSPPLRAP